MMKLAKLVGTSALALALTAGLARSQQPTFETPVEAEVVPGQFIVKATPEATLDVQASRLAEANVTVVETLDIVGAQIVEIEDGTRALLRGLEASIPGVAYIEPVYRVRIAETPTDPRYSEQWGFDRIKAPAAWARRTESGDVIVAVIDTGVDYLHSDLRDNIWINSGETPGNGVDDDGNGIVDDVHGANFFPATTTGDPMDDNRHGTHVAGTIGAVTGNNLGVAGVNWKTRIMGLKFLGADGSGTTAGAIRAIEYGILMKVDIMNNSWGGGGFSRALEEAIEKAHAEGILFVAAAGNANNDNDATPFYPAGYDVPNVVSVMATDRADAKAGFSHFGANSVDLGAPGVDILSTVPGGGYDSFNGTSMATPHVAGAAALVLAEHPSLSVEALKQRLMATVDTVPALSGLSVTGGRLNLDAAIDGGDDDDGIDDCDKLSARIAYQEFFWSQNRRIDSNRNLLSVTVDLPQRMVVDIHGNTSARRIDGSGDTVFRTGFYVQENPNAMWTGSYRRGTFVGNDESRSISSSFAVVLPAGEHTLYWKFWINSAVAQFDSGALTVRAFPCSMGGKLDLVAAAGALDVTESDPALRIRQENIEDDDSGNSVTRSQ